MIRHGRDRAQIGRAGRPTRRCRPAATTPQSAAASAVSFGCRFV